MLHQTEVLRVRQRLPHLWKPPLRPDAVEVRGVVREREGLGVDEGLIRIFHDDHTGYVLVDSVSESFDDRALLATGLRTL